MIPSNEFAGRRQRLFNMMDPGSVLIVFSGVGKVSSADETYPFEVNRNFYYLTGIDQEDSAL
jgi:Xaa-Pro aminopeptidase